MISYISFLLRPVSHQNFATESFNSDLNTGGSGSGDNRETQKKLPKDNQSQKYSQKCT